MRVAGYIQSDAISKSVQNILAQAGYEYEQFSSELTLLRALRRSTFDLILVGMGDELEESENIFSWLSCRSGDTTPVIVVSSISDAKRAAYVLNAGADDFVRHPFEPIELLARISALMRRSNRNHTRRSIQLQGFVLDREAGTFSYNGTPITLTPREFTMAWLFFSSPGVYISRETIGSAIWGTDSEIAGRTIEQHVYKLRKKLQLGPGAMIRTAYSQGYRLELRQMAAAFIAENVSEI